MTAAAPRFRPTEILPVEPIWRGQTVVVAATGPSLAAADLALAREAGVRTIVVNDAWRLAPWADILYGADARWWNHYKGVMAFEGERYIPFRIAPEWSSAREWQAAADMWGLRQIGSRLAAGVSLDPQLIHEGGNGGFQAMNLAVLHGAKRIVLTGFDMGHHDGLTHFFGDHPKTMQTNSPFEMFIGFFESAVEPLKQAGVEVINSSRRSRLECFPYLPMERALC